MFFASGDARSATLRALGKSWILPEVDAARGARYSNQDITLWIKGDTALVERNEKTVFRNCVLTTSAFGEQAAHGLTTLSEPSHHWRAVTGTVSYREPIALHPTAVLIVSLQEVQQEDTPPKLIREQRYPVQHQRRHPKKPVPILFEVRYDGNLIQPSFRYQVSAHIEDRGRLVLVTDTPSAVITGYPNHADLLLSRAPSHPIGKKSETITRIPMSLR